ncbi:MAG: peptidoglycan bridge formation glycyltransferase FemA/FemB family protein [Leptolinea sp.]|jgi:peptidoglycan pentaglycine glycine transferase (the first glycine)|nr:peptidoglycan bridge formation glycyltransferase FemA/FemB family protein [Leptolinea sp.]
MSILTSSEWDKFLEERPDAHLLQTRMWGEFKSHFNWTAVRLANGLTGAQILFRRLPLGLTMAYIPKGPVGVNWRELWPEVHSTCRQNHAIFLRVEPDQEDPLNEAQSRDMEGFLPVGDTIQPRQTILVDLKGDPEVWLSHMKQKTRYNTRLAEKKDVRVVESHDFGAFERLMKTTGTRDGFGVHPIEYYQQVYSLFYSSGEVALLQAECENRPLAMLMVFAHGKRAYYLYGASDDRERHRMPTYLLQFEAMRWAASKKCEIYDLWGIPDAPEEELEANFEIRSDGLWGVYRFKRGFGGRIVRSCPGYDFVYQPLLYRLFRWQMSRSRGMAAG